MSNRRALVFLLLGIAALVLAEFMLERRGTVSSAGGRFALVETESPIGRIVICRRGEPAVVLERGDGWKIIEPYRGSANEPTVLKLIDALTQTAVPTRISDSELEKVGRDRSDFSLVDPFLKVSIRTEDGADTSVSFGVPTPSAEGVYASVEGLNAVFIVPTAVFDAADVTADALRRRALFGISAESVCELGIRVGENAPVVFARDGESWRSESQPASASRLRAYLDVLADAQAVSFVWPVGATNESDHASEALLSSYGLDSDSAVTVTLKSEDGVERRLAFGKDASDGLVYALAQNGSAVVTVPAALKDETVSDPVRFTDSRLFPVEVSAVAAFTLSDGDAVYSFARSGKDSWRIESPVIAEADSAVVDAMLGRIVKLTAADADPDGLSVSISSDANPIRVARSAVLPRAGINAVRSRTVFKVEPDAVKRLVRTPGARGGAVTSVVYSRERKGWNVEKPEGRGEVDEKAVARIVKALSGLTALRVEKLKVTAADLDDYGLDAPYLTLAIDQDREGAVRRNLLLGNPARGGRYATVGSTDAIFVIADDLVERLTVPLVGGL